MAYPRQHGNLHGIMYLQQSASFLRQDFFRAPFVFLGLIEVSGVKFSKPKCTAVPVPNKESRG
jgi:hypothetical protein